MRDVTVTTCQGTHVGTYIDALAQLRIDVFRDYPYLYAGDLSYEADYLGRYAANPRSFFVLAFQGNQLIGAATGQPLQDEVDDFRRPFEHQGFPVSQIFYYGESVLLPDYRGQGIGKRFMAEREQHARQQGFTTTAFCAVERPADHPLKPADYQPLHGFWQAQGYQHHPELATTFRWQDINESAETEKPMVFWLKNLNG
ncbi:GNAT family N-acetyltransferase [Halomonas sp. BLK-85]